MALNMVVLPDSAEPPEPALFIFSDHGNLLSFVKKVLFYIETEIHPRAQ